MTELAISICPATTVAKSILAFTVSYFYPKT
jgi:hypothetical protein